MRFLLVHELEGPVHRGRPSRDSFGPTSPRVLLGQAYRFVSALEWLYLNCSGVGDVAVIARCSSRHFQRLALSHSTNITPRGFKAFATCTNLPSLISLDLSFCKDIGELACAHLKNISLYFSSLTSLDLSFCNLTDQCITALTVDSNLQSIRSLSLFYNTLSLKGFNTISTCASLVGLQSLDFSSAKERPIIRCEFLSDKFETPLVEWLHVHDSFPCGRSLCAYFPNIEFDVCVGDGHFSVVWKWLAQ